MAIGAVFGALNTMYSAVSVRGTEIATLRALGFSGTSVVISVLIEAQLLACVGALFGILVAQLCFNGHVISTVGRYHRQQSASRVLADIYCCHGCEQRRTCLPGWPVGRGLPCGARGTIANSSGVARQLTMKAEDLSRNRLAGVDVLRGLCILSVVLHHIHLRFTTSRYPQSDPVNDVLPETLNQVLFWSGLYAVIAFFVISGFLITGFRFGGGEIGKRSRWKLLPHASGAHLSVPDPDPDRAQRSAFLDVPGAGRIPTPTARLWDRACSRH